jgi:hypothetical protein
MNAQQKRLKNTSGLSLHHHSIWLYFGLSILKGTDTQRDIYYRIV